MMDNTAKHTGKILATIFLFFLFSSISSADVPPDAKDIKRLTEMARQTVGSFMQQSFELRMGYELNDKFLSPKDKSNLRQNARTAVGHLQAIVQDQQNLKKKIEDYQGADWDERYGQTGLWRKLSTDLYLTNLNKCEIDYYLALCSDQPEKNSILKDILAKIDSTKQPYALSHTKLLKGKVLALLARTEPTYKAEAIKQLDTFKVLSDSLLTISAAIEKIKLTGPEDPNQLETLVKTLTQNYRQGNLELILSAAFLQRRYDPPGFEKTVKLLPIIENIVGSLLLSALSLQQQALDQTSVFEAELAVRTSLRNEGKDYTELLERLSNTEKLKTPLILYISAAKTAESEPAKAVGLLIEASKVQKIQKDSGPKISADKIAEQAAKLAYSQFSQDSGRCKITLEAFENYFSIAGKKNDEELEYLYSEILENCGETEKAKELLEKIADRPEGNWRNRARLELTVKAIQRKEYEDSKVAGKLLEQFSSLIADFNDCKYANEAMELLSKIIDEIDEIQKQAVNFQRTAQDCKVLAEFCFGCLEGAQRRQAGLYLAESAILAANKEKEKLTSTEKLLNDIAESSNGDVNFLRCRARLLAEQGKFDKAAELWAQVAQMQKKDTTSENQRSWKWWRAKFYELDCWSKSPQTQKREVLHTIDVLKSTFDNIPPLWAEKLNLLIEKIK